MQAIQIIYEGDIIKDMMFGQYYYVVTLTKNHMRFVDSVGNSLHFRGMDHTLLKDFIIISTTFRNVG